MRRRARCLALLTAVLAGAAGAEPVPDDVYCGDHYWFTVDPPQGWKEDWRVSGEMVSLVFESPSGSAGMQLTLLGGGGGDGAAVDVENVLHGWIGMLNAFGAPSEIRPFEAPHAQLPTAGATLELPGARTSVVALDAGSGRGKSFVASLAREEGAASAGEVAEFRRMVASIDFEPTRACEPGPDGEAVAVTLPAPTPAPPAAPRSREFDLRRAGSGCTTLNQLFVPVYCQMVDLEGERTLLAYFDDDDGTESAQTYLERFTERVAVPFCYESGRHPDGAPRLAFHAENSERVHVYDCSSKAFGRALPASILP